MTLTGDEADEVDSTPRPLDAQAERDVSDAERAITEFCVTQVKRDDPGAKAYVRMLEAKHTLMGTYRRNPYGVHRGEDGEVPVGQVLRKNARALRACGEPVHARELDEVAAEGS